MSAPNGFDVERAVTVLIEIAKKLEDGAVALHRVALPALAYASEAEAQELRALASALPGFCKDVDWLVIRAADILAGAVLRRMNEHIDGEIDARSEIGDALLDYASSRHGDANPLGDVLSAYEKLRAPVHPEGDERVNDRPPRPGA